MKLSGLLTPPKGLTGDAFRVADAEPGDRLRKAPSAKTSPFAELLLPRTGIDESLGAGIATRPVSSHPASQEIDAATERQGMPAERMLEEKRPDSTRPAAERPSEPDSVAGRVGAAREKESRQEEHTSAVDSSVSGQVEGSKVHSSKEKERQSAKGEPETATDTFSRGIQQTEKALPIPSRTPFTTSARRREEAVALRGRASAARSLRPEIQPETSSELHRAPESARDLAGRSRRSPSRTVEQSNREATHSVSGAAVRYADQAAAQVPVGRPVKAAESPESRSIGQRVSLDPQKWSVHHSRQNARSGQEGSGRESRQQNREVRTETTFKPEGLKSSIKAATPGEVEGAVRDGINQLVRKAHVMVGQGGETTARIRMNPDHLGFMSIDMKVQNNQVILKILVDREDVLDQLKKDLDILKGDFARSGLQMESVSVKLRESFEAAYRQEGESHAAPSGNESGGQDSPRHSGRDEDAPLDSRMSRIATADGIAPALISELPDSSGIEVRSGDMARDYDRLLVMNTSGRERRVFSA